MLPAIPRAKDRPRSAAGKHGTGIGGINSNRPDSICVHGGLDMLEAAAAVVAAIDPVIGTSKDHPWVLRIRGQGENLRLIPHAFGSAP